MLLQCVPPKWDIRLMPTVLIPWSPLYITVKGSGGFHLPNLKTSTPFSSNTFSTNHFPYSLRIPLPYLKYVKECK